MLRVTRQRIRDAQVTFRCLHALVILAYFQSSRGLEVASKSPVLSIAFHKLVSEWSLRNRKGLFCVACHLAYKRRFCHVLKCCSYNLQ